MSSLNAGMLIRLAPSILEDVCRHATVGALPVANPLQALFVELFGLGHPRAEQLRFLLFATPIVRQITLASVPGTGQLGASEITFAEVKSWLQWLDRTDPLCARMIDLYYVAGVSIREIASLLSVSPFAVIRELRFAKSWLCIKLPPEG